MILRFFSVLFASAVLISCSKDELTLGKAKENYSKEKLPPTINYGGIAGTLTPTPLTASLKFYNRDANYAASCNADATGYFKIGTLIPGYYDITVAYVWNFGGEAPVYNYSFFELKEVRVEADKINELGDVRLAPR